MKISNHYSPFTNFTIHYSPFTSYTIRLLFVPKPFGYFLRSGIHSAGKLQYYLRIGDVCEVMFFFGGIADAGIVAQLALHIKHQLEMKVRRPVAVLFSVPKSGYLLSASHLTTVEQSFKAFAA